MSSGVRGLPRLHAKRLLVTKHEQATVGTTSEKHELLHPPRTDYGPWGSGLAPPTDQVITHLIQTTSDRRTTSENNMNKPPSECNMSASEHSNAPGTTTREKLENGYPDHSERKARKATLGLPATIMSTGDCG